MTIIVVKRFILNSFKYSNNQVFFVCVKWNALEQHTPAVLMAAWQVNNNNKIT